jgi:MFS family permease
MPDTVAGLFRNRVEAEEALRKLEEAGFSRDQISISSPRIGRRGNYGRKVLIGIAIGTLAGAVVGAIVGGVVPDVHALLPGSSLVIFVIALAAGAATGGVAGGLVSMAASGDTALYFEQEVQAGRFLVTVAGPGLDQAVTVMRAAGAMEAAPVEAPIVDHGRPRPEGG